jgi:hypothetical protein
MRKKSERRVLLAEHIVGETQVPGYRAVVVKITKGGKIFGLLFSAEKDLYYFDKKMGLDAF